MTVQLIVLGTRRPDTDNDYDAYAAASGKLFKDAGAIPAARWDRVGHIAGDNGPEQIMVVDFPDEDSIRALFDSPEYQAVVPHRDAAYETLDIIVASAG